MVLADSHRVSRAPQYLGAGIGSPRLFRLQDYHLLWSNFPEGSTREMSFDFRRVPHDPDIRSRNTDHATRAGLARDRFRLIPFRSPLLGKSQLLSVPRATEMFQFAPLAMDTYGFSAH